MTQKIKLMTDYGCHPLWWDEIGLVGNIDPLDLFLSQNIIKRLYKWSDSFESRLNMNDPLDSREVSIEEIKWFEWEGLQLWKELINELGLNYEVSYSSSYLHKTFTNTEELELELSQSFKLISK